MARHCSVEIAAVIVLDHGLRAGTCRAPTTATFAGGLLALDSGADHTYVGGHTHLDRAEDFDLCLLSRPQRASSDVTDLDIAVFGQGAPVVTRPARGDGEALGQHARGSVAERYAPAPADDQPAVAPARPAKSKPQSAP